MQQRGRKSTAGLVAASNIEPIPRVPPPGNLSDYEAAVWQAVVNTKPADWFQADTLPLLLSYCKHVSHAATLDQEIMEFNREWLRDDEGVKRYKLLTDMRERESRAMTALARSMRLSHQSQYRAEGAATVKGKQKAAKPWQG